MSYKIFNPMTGLHRTTESLEEAKQIKLQNLNEYINANLHAFSIAMAELDQDNNETWSVVAVDDRVVCSYDQN